MEPISIPTGRDIYLEINGRRAAVVESYEARSERKLYLVEELGGDAPAAALPARASHRLTLKRVWAENGAPDFYALSGFDVVVVKPGARVVYSGCEWESLTESVSAGKPCLETAVAVAQRRVAL